jgi:hypothetical protein
LEAAHPATVSFLFESGDASYATAATDVFTFEVAIVDDDDAGIEMVFSIGSPPDSQGLTSEVSVLETIFLGEDRFYCFICVFGFWSSYWSSYFVGSGRSFIRVGNNQISHGKSFASLSLTDIVHRWEPTMASKVSSVT